MVETGIYTLIDMLGTAAFSISGVFAAMERKLDIFGVLVIAFITATGGGTIRDLMIGDFPVTWMRSPDYSVVIFVSAILAILFNKAIMNYSRVLLLFDSIGLGFFTILGIKKGIYFDFSVGLCIAVGTITACFGGLVRDIVLNQIPHILHKEIYAAACIFGGMVYFLLLKTNIQQAMLDLICIAAIVLVRILAVKYHWSLPGIYTADKRK